MDIKSFTADGNIRPYTAEININLYNSSSVLMKSDQCKLIGINGCDVLNYVVFTPGDYYITITELPKYDLLWTSENFHVSQGFALSYFTFSINTLAPSAWSDFKVRLDLTDGCGVPYLETATVTLSATKGISGDIQKTTNLGYIVHDVYCQKSGTNTIIATSQTVTSNTTITVLQDKILLVEVSPTVRKK
jgi:hypothetical protein